MTSRLTLGTLFVAGVGLIAAAAWLWHPAVCLLFLGLVFTGSSILGSAYVEREERRK